MPATEQVSLKATRGVLGKSFLAEPIAPYLATALLCTAILIPVLHLRRADLSVPLYAHSDSYFFSMVVKNLVENGSCNVNRFLGAPGEMELYDFPLPDWLHFGIFRLFSFFSGNYTKIFNAYFLLGFVLIALASVFVCRQLRISNAISVIVSILFAFVPYHLFRGELHITFNCYYSVPLFIGVLLWLCAGEPLFRFGRLRPEEKPAVTRKGVIALAACVMIGSDNAYFAFFAVFFLLIAATWTWLSYHHPGAVVSAGILLATLILTFAINLAPNLIYYHSHDFNPLVTKRAPYESEMFGMKIVQLVLPVTGHRVALLRRLKDHYNNPSVLVNENDFASLGVIGACGFLLLLGMVFRKRKPASSPDPLTDLSILNIAAVLLATIGGFGTLFAVVISPEIRAYNRMSLFIAYFSLLAVGLLIDRWYKSVHVNKIRTAVFYGAMPLLLVIGILDQTNKYMVPAHRVIQATYASDDRFFQKIEGSVPRESMIFQLPYVPFPVWAPVNRMLDYDHLGAYLHSRHLRWSYGAIKGRSGDAWERTVAALPIEKMTETLAFAGFRGIYIDRFGYVDNAAHLETELRSILGISPIISENQRMSFFDLATYIDSLKRHYSPAGWASQGDRSLHLVTTDWGDGCSYQEGTELQSWRWCSFSGELYLVNASSSPRDIQLQMELFTGYGEKSQVRIETPWSSSAVPVNSTGTPFVLPITVPPGRHRIRFSSDAKRIAAPNDPRTLVFRIGNFQVIQ